MPNKRGRTSAKAERPLSCTPVSALRRVDEGGSDIDSSAIAMVIVYLVADQMSVWRTKCRSNQPYCEKRVNLHRDLRLILSISSTVASLRGGSSEAPVRSSSVARSRS